MYALTIGRAHEMSQSPEGWLEYDLEVRSKSLLDSKWSAINPITWQLTIHKPGKSAIVGDSKSSSQKKQICFNWNDGRSCQPGCRRRHVCRSCEGNHPERSCKKRKRTDYGTMIRPDISLKCSRKNFSCTASNLSPSSPPVPSIGPVPPLSLINSLSGKTLLPHSGQSALSMTGPDVDMQSKLLRAFVPIRDPSSVCPVIIDHWDELASDVGEALLRNYVSTGLRRGFHLRYSKGPLVSASRNNPSAYQYKEVVSNYLIKELSRGSIAEPFSSPPLTNLHISRFGVIPKSTVGEWRMILDLSFPPNASVNLGISDTDASVSYEGLDFVIDKIIEAGRGCWLSKFDIQSAYRILPVHPDDRYLLGMRWEGFYFVDLTLSFGGRSAPAIFTAFADMLKEILSSKLKHSIISHYLDDFIQIVNANQGRQSALDESIQASNILEYLGVPIAASKTIRATNILPHLGVILDTLKMEARLPPEKLSDLSREISSWVGKRSGSKRKILSLIGKLMYASQMVHHSRSFLRRLINKSSAVSQMHHRIHLSKEDREDLEWWSDLLSNWNGISLFSFRKWDFVHDLVITSDAAQSKGFGLIFRNHWCSIPWPSPGGKCYSIAVLELIPVAVATYLWGSEWERRKVLFRIDNESVVHALNSGLPKDHHLAYLVRFIAKHAVINSFQFKARHLPGIQNAAADALSRFNIQRFRELRPSADILETMVPSELISYLLMC